MITEAGEKTGMRMGKKENRTARFHLPGLFEFYDLYKIFLPLFYDHREYFYDWCDIGSVYGAPADVLWGGGRVGFGDNDAREVFALMQEYGVSSRLTFSNSRLRKEHLSDRKCNELCALFRNSDKVENGIIIHSDLLLEYIQEHYPEFYFISSTTKVITDRELLSAELNRKEFRYVVPDFRLNRDFDLWNALPAARKDKVEFLCNECCWFGCTDRKACYENVSRKVLGEDCPDHQCLSPDASDGYVFSKAMQNPGFIGPEEIRNVYMPMGFSNFKIEGRSLGSALILEFLLYYMTKPEYQLQVREKVYLDHSLDLF
jgi:collagenase-like PrtC family protease